MGLHGKRIINPMRSSYVHTFEAVATIPASICAMGSLFPDIVVGAAFIVLYL